MKHHRCHDRNCLDCYPEHWQPEDDSHHALAWPYGVVLLVALVALAFLYVSANAPGP